MTEVDHEWKQLEDADEEVPPTEEGPFVNLAHALADERERLAHLAEACLEHGRQLLERESAVAEREQRLAEAEDGLSSRVAELDQRERHVNELADRAEEAGKRIAEAQERETALAALGAEIAARYQTAE